MSSIYRRDIHSQLSVTRAIQPEANLDLGSQDFKEPIPVTVHEKSLEASIENGHHHHHCEYGHLERSESFSEHHSSHNNSNIQLRRFLLPAIFVTVFVALGGLLAWSCVMVNAMPAWEFNLMGRALASDDNLNSTFKLNNKWDTPNNKWNTPYEGTGPVQVVSHGDEDTGQLVPLTHDLLNSNLIISAITMIGVFFETIASLVVVAGAIITGLIICCIDLGKLTCCGKNGCCRRRTGRGNQGQLSVWKIIQVTQPNRSFLIKQRTRTRKARWF
jgi:hypothetical protein